MDIQKNKLLEEKLREASCYGDEEAVKILVEQKNVNVNAQHDINGWTALHWASKRGHLNIVKYLVSRGADVTLLSIKGETASMLTDNEDIQQALGDSSPVSNSSQSESSSLSIIPHFLRQPASDTAYQRDSEVAELASAFRRSTTVSPLVSQSTPNGGVDSLQGDHGIQSDCGSDTSKDLVLKVRVAHLDDTDFIEIEVPRHPVPPAPAIIQGGSVDVATTTAPSVAGSGSGAFQTLVRIACDELGIDSRRVRRIRKLPNTIIRKDRDVSRLVDYQELEFVLDNIPIRPTSSAPLGGVNSIPPVPFVPPFSPPGYLSFTTAPLNSRDTLLSKSSYVMNGTILY